MEIAELMRLTAILPKKKKNAWHANVHAMIIKSTPMPKRTNAWLASAPVMSTKSMHMIAQSVDMLMEKTASATAVVHKEVRLLKNK